MATKRRQFSREFKEEAVRLWTESGRPLSQIARELTIRTEQLRRWRRQLGAVKAEQGAKPETEAQELRRLRRELELTRQERDFLKKAAAFFAKESR
jgi:transposase